MNFPFDHSMECLEKIPILTKLLMSLLPRTVQWHREFVIIYSIWSQRNSGVFFFNLETIFSGIPLRKRQIFFKTSNGWKSNPHHSIIWIWTKVCLSRAISKRMCMKNGLKFMRCMESNHSIHISVNIRYNFLIFIKYFNKNSLNTIDVRNSC